MGEEGPRAGCARRRQDSRAAARTGPRRSIHSLTHTVSTGLTGAHHGAGEADGHSTATEDDPPLELSGQPCPTRRPRLFARNAIPHIGGPPTPTGPLLCSPRRALGPQFHRLRRCCLATEEAAARPCPTTSTHHPGATSAPSCGAP